MNRLGRILLAASLATGAFACQRQDEETQKKLDYLIGKVESLEKKVGAGGGPGPRAAGAPGQQAPQRPARPQVDPTAVYAVDISGAHVEGPANAKITIIEAFEFA